MRNSGSTRSNRSTLRRYSRLIQASGCVKTNFLEADFSGLIQQSVQRSMFTGLLSTTGGGEHFSAKPATR
jgi:hypothetical protein